MGCIGLAVMALLVVLGMHIAFSTALVGFVGVAIMRDAGAAANMLGWLPYGIVTRYAFSVVPLFIIMGIFAYHAGLTDDLFFTARQWVGHLPGGLAIASVWACAGFAACTGASTASAAVMGRVAIPEMRKYGYHPRLASGVVAASGTLASLIPPSVILVIYGMITEKSIGLLLIAGVIPGIVSAAIYAGMIYVRVTIKPDLGRPQPRVSWGQRFYALRKTWGVLVLIIIVIGGIYSGIFTPTEAGGAGAFGAFVMALSMRRLTVAKVKDALLETGRTTVMLFIVIVGVLIFVRFMALTGLPRTFGGFVVELPGPRIVKLLMILSLYVFLGMFINAIGMLMLTLPVVFPAIVALGFDQIWFGIIVVVMCEISQITPPVGLNVYIINSVAPDIPVEEIFRGAFYFLMMDFFTLALFITFPQIITFLPSRMVG